METNFNFKSQICTTREQSERLLALGLKKETADMYLQSILNDVRSPFVPIAFPYSDRPEEIIATGVVNAVPAWSLGRLIEMRLAHDSFVVFQLSNTEDAFEKVISHIEHAIKEGYFNKEYLV